MLQIERLIPLLTRSFIDVIYNLFSIFNIAGKINIKVAMRQIQDPGMIFQ